MHSWRGELKPGFHDLMALIKRSTLTAEGNLQIFIAKRRYFKGSLVKLRATGAAS
ncbi:hypothetical protein [Tardiphaga sp. 367_B4_N1_1]|jgi:hypothetical protein|uniref:hypothetical protein n=1 Tax=Tardiphaga sp. 367_B4_N1_1 TaxID=3240777 RepID=UPI003F2252F3